MSITSEVYEKGSGCKEKLKQQGWNILAQEVSFPIAVIKEQAINNNAQWMQTFTEKSKVKLAPHGKTTMATEFFKLQLEKGCWGISLATVPQVINAYQSGVKRIILANQLIGSHHFNLIADLLAHEDLSFYCFVDSIENAHRLGEFFSARNISLNILLEIGVDGGRCGWRDIHNVMPLVEVIQQYDCLRLSGLSFYEGVIHGDNALTKINSFVESVIELAAQLQQSQAFSAGETLITGAGSAWYDVVAKRLMASTSHCVEFTAIIRPGCYLIHDTGIYQEAQQAVIERSELACDITGELVSSLELWAYVHSIPEPGLAIIGLGKRDVAFDAGLPTPEFYYRPNSHSSSNNTFEADEPQLTDDRWQVTNIMDQHCMMTLPSEVELLPGDLVCFSTSHPCLTMDKWRQVAIVDEKHRVKRTIATYF